MIPTPFTHPIDATRVYATDQGMKVIERELPENRALVAEHAKG